MSRRRVRAIFRKEMREFRRNKQIIITMAISPAGFVVAPVIFLFAIPASQASVLYGHPVQLFTLAVAALLPTVVGAYSVIGERDQGTLEPLLGTPVTTGEFILGKALALLIPAAAESYLIFGIIDGLVWLLRPAAVSAVALRPSILLAQLIFTPLLACLAVWLSMTISAHTRDTRVAQQLGVLTSLPVIALGIMLGFGVMEVSLPLAMALGAALVVLDVAGWPLAAATFNRERLILGR
jgi:ABC-type transport system involved in multi-copper enzyme maturation permease subunit